MLESNDCRGSGPYRYTLLNIEVKHRADADKLRHLQTSWKERVDIWSLRIGGCCQLMIRSEEVDELIQIIKDLGMKVEILIEDVTRILAEQEQERRSNAIQLYRCCILPLGRPSSLSQELQYFAGPDPGDMDWVNYHSFEVMAYHMKKLVEMPLKLPIGRGKKRLPIFKRASRELITIGQSVEERPLFLVHFNPGNSKKKIWIDGGIHAREWVTSAAALFIAHQLIANYDQNWIIADSFDWYIMPCMNPDGYVYSCRKPKSSIGIHNMKELIGYRLWRKNRHDYRLPTGCIGVDLNRNWDVGFSGGPTDDPCSETYAGPAPFSEPETRSMRDFIKGRGLFVAHISFHSYGQLILLPFGANKYTKPANYRELEYVGLVMADSIAKATNTYYKVASMIDELGVTSSSAEWAHASMKIPFSYIIELRDLGLRGFLLPPSEIRGASQDAWEAVKGGFSTFLFRGNEKGGEDSRRVEELDKMVVEMKRQHKIKEERRKVEEKKRAEKRGEDSDRRVSDGVEMLMEEERRRRGENRGEDEEKDRVGERMKLKREELWREAERRIADEKREEEKRREEERRREEEKRKEDEDRRGEREKWELKREEEAKKWEQRMEADKKWEEKKYQQRKR